MGQVNWLVVGGLAAALVVIFVLNQAKKKGK